MKAMKLTYVPTRHCNEPRVAEVSLPQGTTLSQLLPELIREDREGHTFYYDCPRKRIFIQSAIHLRCISMKEARRAAPSIYRRYNLVRKKLKKSVF